MRSGRHCRAAGRERMQGDSEPVQVVFANETGGRAHDAEQRIGRERQTHKLTTPPRPIDHNLFKLKTDIYNGNLEILSMVQRKGCACGSGSGTDDKS